MGMFSKLGFALLGVFGASSAWALPFNLVLDKQPKAVIVVPKDHSEEIDAIAKEMQSLIRQASGVTLTIVEEGAVPASPAGRLHLGLTQFAKSKASGTLAGLKDEGFIIQHVDLEDLVVAGPTDEGTRYGAYHLLESFGIRWLLPGDQGTYVPSLSTVAKTIGNVREEPQNEIRRLSGIDYAWSRHLRMTDETKGAFEHNLHNIIAPEIYMAKHPEFFPVVDGKPFPPLVNGKYSHTNWYPCFGNPGVVDAAAATINAAIGTYFRENPKAKRFYYSLSISDGAVYACEKDLVYVTDAEGNRVPKKIPNSNGVDVSNAYYTWVNRVVKKVVENPANAGKDLQFGLLAYGGVSVPPVFALHPRVTPLVTKDRLLWKVNAEASRGYQQTDAWDRISSQMGWYDYVYGGNYLIPRVYFHWMAKYLNYGRTKGVRTHYAEVYRNWGEGPKAYIHMKLLWDPRQNIDALLQDWYEKAVGEAAAPALAEYYKIWEEFWAPSDGSEPRWKSMVPPLEKVTYMDFTDPSYLGAITPDMIARSRSLLNQVVGLARTPDEKYRAGVIEQAFRYYEASAGAYLIGNRMPPPSSPYFEASAFNAASRVLKYSGSEELRYSLVSEFSNNPVLRHFLPFNGISSVSGRPLYPKLWGKEWSADSLWWVDGWMDRSARIREVVQEIARQKASPVLADQAQRLLDIRNAQKSCLVSENGGFDEASTPSAEVPAWERWVSKNGSLEPRASIGITGSKALEGIGIGSGVVYQTVDASPGTYFGICNVRVPVQPEKGAVKLVIIPQNSAGEKISAPAQSAVYPTPGDWRTFVGKLDIAPIMDGQAVKTVRLEVQMSGFGETGRVYLDECRLYRMGSCSK